MEVSAGPTVQLAPPGAVIVTVRSAVTPLSGSSYEAYVPGSTKPPGRPRLQGGAARAAVQSYLSCRTTRTGWS